MLIPFSYDRAASSWCNKYPGRGLCDLPFDLPRTTERPVRERGDDRSELPARAVPQSLGRKSVVRGLPVDTSYSGPGLVLPRGNLVCNSP
jgi:hypothetical protein